MGRMTKAAEHLSEEQILERIQEAKKSTVLRKWLAILHALTDPAPARVIAVHSGLGDRHGSQFDLRLQPLRAGRG